MTDSNDDDDNEPVGFGRPPRKHQFKKGQSGCPDGGHAQRMANKRKRLEKEKAKNAREEQSITNLIGRVAREPIKVRTSDGRVMTMAKAEAAVRKLLDRALSKDASDRAVKQALDLLKYGKILEPTRKERPMVLVVNQIKSQEKWAKETEGELLPRDPLHGIPGAEGLLNRPGKARGTTPDDEDDN